MPTYNQGAFISRAISSLKMQDFCNWELIIINDSSTDYTEDIVQDLLSDGRITYYKNENNEGLGFCLNFGIEISKHDLIAYLPSDDIYFENHLSRLSAVLDDVDCQLAYAGIKHDYYDSASDSECTFTDGKIADEPLQLVQVLHRKSDQRWMERNELVTDDLEKMFWSKLGSYETFKYSGAVTCEWIDHPEQRHKIIRENSSGGIYLYKRFYNVVKPIRFQSSVGNEIDEVKDFERIRNLVIEPSEKPLKILLVGELAFNPERIRAFEEQGHTLYGLWINSPHCYNAIGPIPYGNVIDIPLETWIESVNQIKPDIIYALLNYQAIAFAHYIMLTNPGIPFVWHFKEGPFMCRRMGLWKELVELYINSDGQIYINQEVKNWFGQFLTHEQSHSFILDGDLPKKEWFNGVRSPLLSDSDGEIHTVVPGRPMGLTPEHVQLLSRQKIHLHLYGDMQQMFWKNWISFSNDLAPGYLHIHPHCKPENWVRELSQYNAGWLHYFTSNNHGEYMKATWPDLNYPARMTTLAAAGLPMIQKNNQGHIVAAQILTERLDIGIFFNTFDDLGQQLKNTGRLNQLSNNVSNNRFAFSFDHHVKDLIDFFRRIIDEKQKKDSSFKNYSNELSTLN
jgi:glycosyltransferase involved in cell wall biosynthesis